MSGRSIAWIVGFGATLMTVRFGPTWVLTYHEVFFAEPAREFLRTGDWIAPRIAGLANYQKPPLVSWLIAAMMAATGSTHETVVRFPTLLADLLNACLVAALAARWYGDRIGRLAGLVQLTTFYAIFQSRLAEADMPLCAATTVCMLAFCLGVVAEGGRRRGWAIAYFAGAVATFLIKGPIGLAFVGLPCGLFAIGTRRRDAWKFLLDPVGWLVLVVGCLAWPVLAYRQDPTLLDHMVAHNLDRFSGSMEGGREGPFYYLYMVPLILLPWTPFVVVGIRAVVGDSRRPSDFWKFLGLWAAVPLALISLSAWKHKHYAIPALPPASILAALGLVRLTEPPAGRLRRGLALGGIAVGLAAAVACVPGVGATSGRGFGPALAPALFAMAAGLVVLAWGQRRLGPSRRLGVLFGTTWLVVVLVESCVMPHYDRYRPLTELARELNARLPEDAAVELVGIEDPQITFYLDRPLHVTREFPEFLERLRSAGVAECYLVGPDALVPDLESLGRVEVLRSHVGPRSVTAARLRIDPPRLAEAIEDETRR